MATPALETYCFSVQSTLVKGDHSPRVEALCRLLATSGRGFNLAGIKTGDLFTPAVEATVKQFQKQTFLQQDGIVGPFTWQALCENAPTHMPALRLGEHTIATHIAQQSLKSLGFYGGAIDGYFGPETHFSVIDFQATFGIVGDGILDITTWDKLGRAASLAVVRA